MAEEEERKRRENYAKRIIVVIDHLTEMVETSIEEEQKKSAEDKPKGKVESIKEQMEKRQQEMLFKVVKVKLQKWLTQQPSAKTKALIEHFIELLSWIISEKRIEVKDIES